MDSLARTRVRNRGTRRAIACAVVYARPMEQRVEFRSDGLRLSGVLHVPDDRKVAERRPAFMVLDRKSTRLNSSHTVISYAVFCLKKKNVVYLTKLQTQTHI